MITTYINMAGNGYSEWTELYAMNFLISLRVMYNDEPKCRFQGKMPRKSIRCLRSWKDVAYFLQVSTKRIMNTKKFGTEAMLGL